MYQAYLLLRDYEQSGRGWFWSTGAEGLIEYISECAARKMGKSAAELIGQSFNSIFILEGDKHDTVERTLPLILSAHKTFSDLEVRADAEAEETWWAISGRPQLDSDGEFTGYFGNGIDITASRQSKRDASRLAMYDSLTGLANRHSMNQRLSSTLAAYKAAKRSCALMMMDLDRFKQVNDTLGHPAGDDLLKQVAQRVQNIIDKGCEIGRLGGDEFQLILPDVDDRGKLGEIAKSIISIVSQPYIVEGSRAAIGASIGIAIAPYDGVTSEELIRSADLALYAAKDGGRGQFRFFSHDLQTQAARRRQIEEDLRHALSRDEMRLAYQPIVEARTNKVVALEAGLRWEHPDLGDISPDIFIPVAEECNLLTNLGDWVLKQACMDAVQWPGGLRVAVNVSPAQFGNIGFPATVTQALANSGLDPERLELELTEEVFLTDEDVTEHLLNSLRILGIRLSLDGFGIGYSSLGYLRKASFDTIKIAKEFILGVAEEGNRNVAIIKSIASLAAELGMEVTADGIEAHDELALMVKLGIRQVQGGIYAASQGSAEVSEALSSGQWVIEPNGPSKYRNDRKTVFRKVGVIHENHRYEVMMRNLSRTGCLIEGLLDVPLDTLFVVDFGEGQLAVSSVKRTAGSMQGLEFELPLVDDGAGGLCTRNRVSPYVLAAAGMPVTALPSGDYGSLPPPPGGFSMPKFAQLSDGARKGARQGG